ncbi:zinc finger protein 596-like [Diorhabda carinulata]|uniref:zinc finger protein 596-like n=1 Tax=Diorhabda carinulata TaxID=1163345 RepID=UPI0025A16502|nr:zinc finger protein 596-like [Diorhabda carinulata]
MSENVDLLDTLCRTCLKPTVKKYTLTGKLKNLEVTIADMLEFCTSKLIPIREDLPENICTFCYNTIRVAYEFFRQFNNAQDQINTIRQILLKEQVVSDHNYETEEFEYDLLTEERAHNDEEIVFTEKSEIDNLEHNQEEKIETIVSKSNLDTSDIELTVIFENRENIDEKLFPYICPICATKYSRIEQFHKHIIEHNCSIITCSRCQAKPEYEIADYIIHYKEFHKLQCNICNKRMASAFGYKYHMKTHIHFNGYKCPIKNCYRSFLLRHLLRKHIKNHYQPTVFPCHLCSSTFNNRDTLRYHIKKHSNKKDHLCTVCGRTFYMAGHLKDHMYRHSGFKKFLCNMCNKRFTRSTSLKKHIVRCTKKKSNS